MAPEAAAVLDRIKPPAGVIMPPPGEMREVIEKTAGYAVRGGAGIEARLREHHSGNPKFSFVTNPDDPFHAYYAWRKEEYRAGRVTAVAAGRAGEAGGGGGGGGGAAAAADAAAGAARGPEKPPDYAFSARLPIMNARDLDILRLTASFAAVHGRAFLTTLLQREVNNPQFQFLRPNHSLHNYFQRMVDQYALINEDLGRAPAGDEEGGGSEAGADGASSAASSSAARFEALRRTAADRFAVLLRAKQRIAYHAWEASQRKHEEQKRDAEKEALARIDWTNFTVLETIVFDDADEDPAAAALPPPTSLNDLQYASLEDKSRLSLAANRMIEEAFPFE